MKKGTDHFEIFGWVGRFIKDFLTSTIENGLEQLRAGVEEVIRKGVQTVTGFLILIIGLIFLLVGVAHTISEFMEMGKGIGFILTGVLTALMGIWIIERIQCGKK